MNRLRVVRWRTAIEGWRFGCLVAAALWLGLAGSARAATVTIDGATTYQVIDGFGVNINHADINEVRPVLDAFVDQAGMTLFRVIYDRSDWEAGNDNADPNVMNWSYYNSVYSSADFQNLWDVIGYLNQKGIADGVMLNFMGGGPSWMVGTSLTPGYEAEWAEMIASLLIYARDTRHLQFGLVGPNNEPDNSSDSVLKRILTTKDQYVTSVHLLAQLLDAHGMSGLGIVSPDLAWTSTDWLSAMMNDPVVMAKLAHVGIHCYNDNFGGPSTGVDSFLKQSSYPNMNFWMTEYNAWCQSCEGGPGGDNSWEYARSTAYYTLNHLANGAAGAMVFTGYDTWFAYLNGGLGGWSYWGLFAVDNINAVPKTFTPRKGFYTMTQLSKFIRPGARRIGLSGYLSLLNLQAFYHPGTGQLVLAGVNQGGATSLSGTLANLPAVSSLDLYYTSSSVNLFQDSSVPVSNGSFTATVPGDCVFTLVSHPPVSVLLTSPQASAQYAAPANIPLQASASSTVGSISLVEFFNGANKVGQAAAAPYSLTWSNAPSGDCLLSARATDSGGNVAVSPTVHVTVLAPSIRVAVSPSGATVLPYGAQQFTAVATDGLGTNLTPQPAFAWSVSGGAIDTNGVFSAGGQIGGPFTVTASSGGASGTATVSVAATRPVLPPQSDVTINPLTTLLVTNAAIANPFASQLVTNSFPFSYGSRDALLADGWSFMGTTPINTARDTETAAGAGAVDYNQGTHPGVLSIPCDVGDLYEVGPSVNNTRNTLFRSLPADWQSVRLALSFAPVTADYQQAHLGLYQDDDNYVQMGVAYNHYDLIGNQRFTLDNETGGVAITPAKLPTTSTLLNFRLDRNAATSTVTAYYSLDGAVLGTTSLTLANPRLMIWTGGAQVPYASGGAIMGLQRLDIIRGATVPTVLNYSLINPPYGATIGSNGIITWKPGAGSGAGPFVVTTVVTDNGLPPLSATNSFAVLVLDLNVAPVLPPQPDRTIYILNPLTVTNTVTEADPAATLSYQLQDPPPGATISSNGIISWTPGIGRQNTTNRFVTVVTSYDPGALNAPSLSATNSFNVVVLAPPWPVLPNQPARTASPLTTLTVTNTAVDGALTANQMVTNTILFNYANRAALQADGWSFMASGRSNPNTEITTGLGQIDYSHPGVLNVPCDVGDLYGPSANDTRNTLFRSLSADWQSVRLALNFAPVTADYQQAHLGLYQDDDNYVQMGVAYNHYDLIGNQRFTLDRESGGFPRTPAETPTTSTALNFRLDRNPTNSTVTASYLDGATWTVLGTAALTLASPRLLIWTGGAQTAYAGSGPIMSLQRLDITEGAPAPAVLSYALISPPSGATIDNNGIITWTPGAATPAGPYVLMTIVTDNGLPPLSATNSFGVTVMPAPAPFRLLSVAATNSAVFITWESVPGSTYRLQYKTNLGGTNWRDVAPDITANGPVTTGTNNMGSEPSRLYRVIIP